MHSEKDVGSQLYCHPCYFPFLFLSPLFLCLFLLPLSRQAAELLLGMNFSLPFTSCVTMNFPGLSSPYLLNRGQDPSLSSGMRPGGETQACLILLCFPLLHFTDTVFFYELKVCGHPASIKSMGAIFLIACAHFVSLHHIVEILVRFQTFLPLLYLVMICDV